MIPKIIHYCWFGNKPLPKLAKKCINSWKKYCPDYEIIEWNEKNYDITKNKYMYQAYKAKKWAFVSDYVRKDVVYTYGGIYLDTDVEIIKNIDELLNEKGFFGMEKPGIVQLGLGFGSEKGVELIRELRDIYNDVDFILKNGEMNLSTNQNYENPLLIKKGFLNKNNHQYIEGIHIYPTDFFAPKDGYQSNINITQNTYSIHHYCLSWMSPFKKIRGKIYWTIRKIFGINIANSLKIIVGHANTKNL